MDKHFFIAIIGAILFAFPVAALSQPDNIIRETRKLPKEYQSAVSDALNLAQSNVQALINVIHSVRPDQLESAAFLLANMPEQDLQQVTTEFITENIQLAHQVMQEVPWGKDIPKKIFLNNILPYAQVNERRDNWRKDFYDRFIQIAQAAGTIDKAAILLNQKVFEKLGVSYHATKRPRPDQSPYESIKAKYASCTGLSILYADALRSVGIPARLVAIPQWKDKSGNHTWVEVWDGKWQLVGASESEHLGEAWFLNKKDNIDSAYPQHRVYAVSFQKTKLLMPLAWNPENDSVYGIDVTARYLDLLSDER